jgi:hypothetical protein
MFTRIENTAKPTLHTGKPKEKNAKTSHKTSSSSQTATTSVKTSISSTTTYNVNNKTSKSQLSKGPPQEHGKLIKDPVQVHNRDILMIRRRNLYGIFLLMIHHLPWMSRHQELGDLRADFQRAVGGKDPNGRKVFPQSDTHDGSDHPMELSSSKG